MSTPNPTTSPSTDQSGEILSLFLKIFLFFFLLFACPLTLVGGDTFFNITASLFSPQESGLIVALGFLFVLFTLAGVLLSVAILSGLISLVIVYMHVSSVRRISSGKFKGALDVRHSREIELKLPYDEAFNQCLEAALIRSAHVQRQDRGKGHIVAKTIIKQSWGELITFDLKRIDDELTGVKVSSQPLRRILTDKGINLENVETIAAFLKLKEQQKRGGHTET
jgi:hypothetical protein